MKIGLPFLTQLRGQAPKAAGITDESGRTESTGGWAALSFQQLVASITTSWNREHNDDDTHKTITATGTISERRRTTAIGAWIAVPFVSTDFLGTGGATWAVTASELMTFAYTLVGTTMILAWQIEASTLAFAATPILTIKIPAGAMAVRSQLGSFGFDDNGTRGTGIAQVGRTAGTQLVEFRKDIRGGTTWASSANLSLFGQLAFEVTGV